MTPEDFERELCEEFRLQTGIDPTAHPGDGFVSVTFEDATVTWNDIEVRRVVDEFRTIHPEVAGMWRSLSSDPYENAVADQKALEEEVAAKRDNFRVVK